MADMDKQEKIGFHKGALDTLVKEREEVARIVSIVEQIMQIKLTPEEDAALKKSAASVKELVDLIGM